jgi:hypothetical protein
MALAFGERHPLKTTFLEALMKDSLFARRSTLAILFGLVSAASACDGTQDLMAPEDLPIVVLGRVASISHADPTVNLALGSTSSMLGGI